MSDPLDRIADALDRIAEALERQATAAASVVARIPPEGLSKEDAARFIGEDVATIENLIRTRKLEYVQHGSQRGRLIPVEALRKFLKEYRQEAFGNGEYRSRK
jgi:hypothetical protein